MISYFITFNSWRFIRGGGEGGGLEQRLGLLKHLAITCILSIELFHHSFNTSLKPTRFRTLTLDLPTAVVKPCRQWDRRQWMYKKPAKLITGHCGSRAVSGNEPLILLCTLLHHSRHHDQGNRPRPGGFWLRL